MYHGPVEPSLCAHSGRCRSAPGIVAIPNDLSRKAGAEEHRWRKIHAACEALREAKEEIEHTGHEWGGQKREAIEAINRALVHLERMRDWH